MSSAGSQKVQTWCPNCQKQFLVAKEHVGKKAKCTDCQSLWIVAAPPPSPSSSDLSDLLDETYSIAPTPSPLEAVSPPPESPPLLYDPRREVMERARARASKPRKPRTEGLKEIGRGLGLVVAAVGSAALLEWVRSNLLIIFPWMNLFVIIALIYGVVIFLRGLFRVLTAQ